MTKLKNSNCHNSKKHILTKFKNSNSDNTQKLKLWQNSITQNVSTQKVKIWQNSKNQIVTKLRNSNCDRWDFSGQLFAISRCFINKATPSILFRLLHLFYPWGSNLKLPFKFDTILIPILSLVNSYLIIGLKVETKSFKVY